MGKRYKQSANWSRRASGNEPVPGPFAGVKRWAKYLRRSIMTPVVIKNPSKYRHSHARRMDALVVLLAERNFVLR